MKHYTKQEIEDLAEELELENEKKSPKRKINDEEDWITTPRHRNKRNRQAYKAARNQKRFRTEDSD